MVATGSWDKAVIVWDRNSGQVSPASYFHRRHSRICTRGILDLHVREGLPGPFQYQDIKIGEKESLGDYRDGQLGPRSGRVGQKPAARSVPALVLLSSTRGGHRFVPRGVSGAFQF